MTTKAKPRVVKLDTNQDGYIDKSEKAEAQLVAFITRTRATKPARNGKGP